MKSASKNALNLILKYEVGGGRAYYDKYLSKFTWPGGASGPTIGIGIDCAYYSKDELARIFNFLPVNQIELIQQASGKTGQAGREYVKKLRQANIKVNWDSAVDIFEKLTWPKFSRLAERAFPQLDELCEDAYGAIVSLVFNRGTSMRGESRREMREIRDLVIRRDYRSIAHEFRKMKRIWKGKGLDGLLERRDAEANLVLSCVD
jgi:GH24 family phage-related lysozyme (muramidase)